MTNNIFIDISVLIEAYKGNKVKFYDSLFSNVGNQFFINDIVLSESVYFILGFHSGVSPRTMQQRNALGSPISNEIEQIDILQEFNFLSGNYSFLSGIPQIMAKYNLLPNDAIILAACQLHERKLASHDADFIIPCESETLNY